MAETECKACGRPGLTFRIDLGQGVEVNVSYVPDDRAVGVAILMHGDDVTRALEPIALALVACLERELAAMGQADRGPEVVQLGPMGG